MEKEIAKFILSVLTRASVPCSDADLRNATVSRDFLQSIVDGKLVVVTAAVANAVKEAVANTPREVPVVDPSC